MNILGGILRSLLKARLSIAGNLLSAHALTYHFVPSGNIGARNDRIEGVSFILLAVASSSTQQAARQLSRRRDRPLGKEAAQI